MLKRMYRAPIDYVEEVSTGKADRILVNSKFTGETRRRATSLHESRSYLAGGRPLASLALS